VIEDLLATGLRPRVLLVEYHHRPFPKPAHNRNETQKSVAALKSAGYKLFWVSDLGSEYGFIL
jgi:homospermidine synthase